MVWIADLFSKIVCIIFLQERLAISYLNEIISIENLQIKKYIDTQVFFGSFHFVLQ